MYESRKQPLASRATFFKRLLGHGSCALLLIGCSLFMGMLGYHYIAKLAWIDAFVDAAMILSGMGPVSHLETWGAKLFAGLYAIYSGLLFISIIAIILIPVWHRVLHTFHIAAVKDD